MQEFLELYDIDWNFLNNENRKKIYSIMKMSGIRLVKLYTK